MSEFDDLVKKAGKTAKTAAKKTGELYESAKLNWKIATKIHHSIKILLQ